MMSRGSVQKFGKRLKYSDQEIETFYAPCKVPGYGGRLFGVRGGHAESPSGSPSKSIALTEGRFKLEN